MGPSRQEAGPGKCGGKAAEQRIEPENAVGAADADQGDGDGKEAAEDGQQGGIDQEAEKRQHQKVQKYAVYRKLKIVIEEDGQGEELQEKGLAETGQERMGGHRQFGRQRQREYSAEAQLKAGTEEEVGLGEQQKKTGGGQGREHVIGAAQGAGQKLQEQHDHGTQCRAGAAGEDTVAQNQQGADEGGRIVRQLQPPE